MTFSVTMNRVVEAKVKRLTEHSPRDASAKLFWKDLAKVLTILSDSPVERGEILYAHQHVELCEYVAVFEAIAVHYAVNEETRAVFVTNMTLSGRHPYPPEFEDILNQEPS